MWSSFEKPSDLEQQQANALANAQDDVKRVTVPDGFIITPKVSFEVVGKVAKPFVTYVLKTPVGNLEYVTLAHAQAVAVNWFNL
jgi:hypothetical protein